MRDEVRQPDREALEALLARHPADLTGLVLRLAWRQGLSREEIVSLQWAQVDFQSGQLYLPDRTLPLDPDTAACLAARYEHGGAESPNAVTSDKFRRPLRPESASRVARTALDEAGLTAVQLKDLRRDFVVRQLAEHDWPHAVRVSGLSVTTYQTRFAGEAPRRRRPARSARSFDEFRLWQILQKEDDSAAGLALWMSWQMGVSATDLAALTWDRVDLAAGVLRLPGGEVPLTNAVRRLLERARSARAPGDDPHVLLSPRSRRPMDLARLSRLVQTALIRGGLEDVTLRDIRAAGERREDDRALLEHARVHGAVTRRDAMRLLGLSDTAAYARLHRLAEAGELEAVGKKYYLPGTVVPEDRQWEAVSAYLREAGFAYCQDLARVLRVSRRKTAAVLRRMVADGRLTQFEKRYYLAHQPEEQQVR